jgi:uncharacterized membrane protein
MKKPQKKVNPPDIIHEQSTKIVSQKFSGPLPPPELLEGYERILPGAADRILKMAELAQEEDNRQVVLGNDHSRKANTRGQWLSFSILMTSLCIAAFAIYKDQEVAASILAAVNLPAAIGAVYGRMAGNKTQLK